MSKLAPTSTKYIIKAYIKAKGIVEKPDVIGAVFGQTEGLLGSGLDLRELQRTGRIGRIDVELKLVDGNSEGEIIIPSSLDASETSLIAATLETIERVGPCTAEIKLLSVEDTREDKRKYVMDKAKEILKGLQSSAPATENISERIKESVRVDEVTNYNSLPCGPDMLDSDNVIIVEGRADVVNLLRYGIRNTIAIEGTSIPPAVIELAKEKVTTVFVDGDRGGQLIVRELMEKADIDYVATAPEGKEVEELTQKEAYKALREKIPADRLKSGDFKETSGRYRRTESRPRFESRSRSYGSRGTYSRGESRGRSEDREYREEPRGLRISETQKELFKRTLEDLVGSRAAYIFDSNNDLLGKVPVSELSNILKTVEHPHTVIFDGKIDFDLASIAKKRGVKFLVGMEKDRISLYGINMMVMEDLN